MPGLLRQGREPGPRARPQPPRPHPPACTHESPREARGPSVSEKAFARRRKALLLLSGSLLRSEKNREAQRERRCRARSPGKISLAPPADTSRELQTERRGPANPKTLRLQLATVGHPEQGRRNRLPVRWFRSESLR